MTQYIDIENSLIEKIFNKDLRISLAQIRKSVEAIWSVDAPRIIQGFTDHGMDHSLRLIKYASQLLNANRGDKLSDEEMYLLIAGIYLHDIGMQCDLVKFDEIKNKAIEFGAEFKIEYTSTNGGQYTIPEQIEIRNNHHFLSAAWIDYAYCSSETVLGQSIKSVPEELILDLLEICKYHSKLNISDCDLQFKLNPKGRKQLIATLVRFADELDVAKSRVSIETVLNFSFEPENAYYWWLHHLTSIDISDNVLSLKVRLKSEDYNAYSSFIKETYIENFEKKNKLILDILNSNKIPISISAESKVIKYNYAKKIPVEIEELIQKMQSREVEELISSNTETRQLPTIHLKNFPKSKDYFAGRKDELKELNEVYENHSFIFIEGGGGIGKTQLVAKFIEGINIKNRIVWYDCLPTSQADDLINGAGFDELLKGKEKTEREKFSAFKDKIEEYDLVVFLDNYQELEKSSSLKSFLAFINEYLRKGHLIVLGRDNIVSPNMQPKRISIKGLGDDSILHARRLIEYSYKNLSTSDEDLKSICKSLKGYPLAIDLAIYLLDSGVSVQNIINVAVKESQTTGSDIEMISNRLLNEIFTRSDASEDERSFMKLFSIFRGEINEEDAMSVIPHAIYESAKRKLITRNLLDINNSHLELHPLVREFCYNQLDNKKEVHHKASNYFIKKRDNKLNSKLEEKIFYHLSCAEQWNEIANTIIQFGREFILHGYLDRLQQMIGLVKENRISSSEFEIFEGDIAEIKGEWDMALSVFEKARQSSKIDVKIEGMIKYGEMLYRKGKAKEAQIIFEDAVELTKNNDSKKYHARALNDVGLVHEFFGNNNEALKKQITALKIREEIDEREGIATSFNNIGLLKCGLGHNNEALVLFEKSLKIYEEIGAKSGIAISLNNIGEVKKNLGFENEALDFYEKCLKIKEEIGDKQGIAISLNNIGSLKNDLGLKKEALVFYEKSLKIEEEIGDKSGIAGSLNNIGIFLFENNGDLEKACFYLLKAFALLDQMGMPEKKGTEFHLIQMRKKIGAIKFEDMLHAAYQKLDDELRNFIDLNMLLGKPVKVEKTPGRNDSCSCGSGKKYKNCHGKLSN